MAVVADVKDSIPFNRRFVSGILSLFLTDKSQAVSAWLVFINQILRMLQGFVRLFVLPHLCLSYLLNLCLH